MVALLSARRFHGLVAFVAFALLAVAFYMEYQMGLEPCPLCMLQRIAFFCVGVMSLLSALTGSVKVRKACAWVVTVLSLIGAALAIRHLYLQSLPSDELPACLPGLSYMSRGVSMAGNYAGDDHGDRECGEVHWTLFGISIPGWTLLAFIGMALVNIVIALRVGKKTSF